MTISKQPAEFQSGSSPFRARARLIRLLGEELISNEVMAVAELVKNGYDADARKVHVSLENITDPVNGLIRIEDDGCGMDLDTLLHSWLEPATHHKRARGEKIRTSLGRIQLGEKGVGRFAADKLGSELELVTRREGSEEETVVKVSWHHYEHDRYLDEVENNWFTREPVEFAGKRHGTLLVIRGLRTGWTVELAGRVHNGLLRLVTPTASSSDFEIQLICPEFPEVSGRVFNPLLDTAPYRLSGTVDIQGKFRIVDPEAEVNDLRARCQSHFVTDMGLRDPVCGPFTIALNIWDLESVNRNGTGLTRTKREEVKAYSGVSIYRDGFRIWPYGEKDDDWLELNQRRVNNPTLRVSNNQLIGFVEITHGGNPDLRDRTSREGLLDTLAFFDLKALVVAALSVLEEERFRLRRPTSALQKKQDVGIKDEVLASINRVRATSEGDGIRTGLQELERLYRERQEEERRRYSYVARLAGTGMAAEILTEAFSKEVSQARKLLKVVAGELETSGNEQSGRLVKTLSTLMNGIYENLELRSPLYRQETGESEPVDIAGVIYDVYSMLQSRLDETGLKLEVSGNKRLKVRMSRGHLMQVVMILLENALLVMKDMKIQDPAVEIRLVSSSGFKGIMVADNGPGVPEYMSELIFQPYFSARPAGRGLGLYVARDILEAYNSTIELASNNSLQSGACFAVRFDGRRVLE